MSSLDHLCLFRLMKIVDVFAYPGFANVGACNPVLFHLRVPLGTPIPAGNPPFFLGWKPTQELSPCAVWEPRKKW
jgi:hypothetical protein